MSLLDSVVAGLLVHPDCWERVAVIVGEPPGLLTDPWSFTMWTAFGEVVKAGVQPDPLVLREKMLALVGKTRCLAAWTATENLRLRDLVTSQALVTGPAVVVDAAERYANTQANTAIAAYLQSVAGQCAKDTLADPFARLDDLHDYVRKNYPRAARVALGNAADTAAVALDPTRAKQRMIPTGFTALDHAMGGGVETGQVTLLGGRTGGGKSKFLQAIARNQIFPDAAKPFDGKPTERLRVNDRRTHVLLILGENTKEMFHERLACDMLDIVSVDMRRDKQAALDSNETSFVKPSKSQYLTCLQSYERFTVLDEDDLPSLSIDAICATIEGWADAVLTVDPSAEMLVLVDYLQRIDPSQAQDRETRARQIELAAKQCKSVTRRRNLALILAVMLNDHPDNPEPRRGDIRDSRGGNNEAANIWLLHSFSGTQCKSLHAMTNNKQAKVWSARMSLLCDKARSVREGWRVLFDNDGDYHRITDGSDDGTHLVKPDQGNNYLLDPDVLALANEGNTRGPAGKRKRPALTVVDADDPIAETGHDR